MSLKVTKMYVKLNGSCGSNTIIGKPNYKKHLFHFCIAPKTNPPPPHPPIPLRCDETFSSNILMFITVSAPMKCLPASANSLNWWNLSECGLISQMFQSKPGSQMLDSQALTICWKGSDHQDCPLSMQWLPQQRGINRNQISEITESWNQFCDCPRCGHKWIQLSSIDWSSK